MVGKTLGPYKIIEQLGAGGMGEVYLGEDTRLGRKVAIKVLPEEYASDPERLARFEQEARAAAALNHPHIAVVHDVGSETGDDGTITHFMVQEYLEGQSLRERLEKGALPLDKALDLAIEVGEALIAAHKAGIIHRDLKPDNIFVTTEGHAKVLDFGLAKLTELAAPGGAGISMSPTVLGTVAGQVMGTAGYMAPEQVQGDEEIDQRVDLFAFGCVLYEIVSGKRAFGGETVLDTLHAIARTEPQPLGEIKPDLPVELQRILRKCLTKDRGRRYQNAVDVTVDLQQLQDDVVAGLAPSVSETGAVATTAAAPGATPTEGGAPEEGTVPGAAAATTAVTSGVPMKLAVPLAIALLLAGAATTYFSTRPALAPRPVTRFDVPLPEGANFSRTGRRTVAISPDGSKIVFNAYGQLWMRELDTDEVVPLRNTEGSRSPFFSPKGEQIGFESGGMIQRVALSGGAPIDLAAEDSISGASWAENGMIYYGGRGGIFAVAAAGGIPAELIIPVEDDERAHGPQLLPGGEWLLFSFLPTGASWDDASIVIESLVTGVRHELIPAGSDARHVPSGHIVYGQEGSLLAVAFDLETLAVSGGTMSLVEGVARANNVTGAFHFAVSDTGSLTYAPGSAGGGNDEVLVWVDEAGNEEPLGAPPNDYSSGRVSPDGTRVAVTVGSGGEQSIYMYDLASAGFERRTYNDADQAPVWSPDGSMIAYSAGTGQDGRQIWVTASDGSGEASLLLGDPDWVYPLSWALDGSLLVLRRTGGQNEGLFLLGVDSEDLQPIVDTEFDEWDGRLSPDGAWLAYTSYDSGAPQVFVRTVPGPSGRWPVSPGPGTRPVWSPDGRTVYYMGGDSMWAVDMEFGETATVTARRELFNRRGYTSLQGFGVVVHDIDPVTGRFLMIKRGGGAAGAAEGVEPPHIKVILNWFEELKQQVPTGR